MGLIVDFCKLCFEGNCDVDNNNQMKISINHLNEVGRIRHSQSKFKIIKEEEIDKKKSIITFKIGQKPSNNLEVFHFESIATTMDESKQYIQNIDKGNALPFIINTIEQTKGRGTGNRNWVGSIKGNIYTSSCIPINMIENEEINNKDMIVKITAISIIQQLRKYSEDQFFLKHPNDIICKDRKKLGGILVENFSDFYIIGFGINIVNKPEESQMRVKGLSPCFINEHLTDLNRSPNALDLSIDITINIIYNLKFNKDDINNLFEQYVLQSNMEEEEA